MLLRLSIEKKLHLCIREFGTAFIKQVSLNLSQMHWNFNSVPFLTLMNLIVYFSEKLACHLDYYDIVQDAKIYIKLKSCIIFN